MNKQQAINEMIEGAKVTHRYFSDDEWMTIQDGRILLEDGVRCSIQEFFSTRNTSDWDEDYTIVTEREFEVIGESAKGKTFSTSRFDNEAIHVFDSYRDIFDYDLPKQPKNFRGTYVNVRTEPKIGNNDKCPCGSGKKYKKCCK